MKPIWDDELDLECEPYPIMVDYLHRFNGTLPLMGDYGIGDKPREIW